MEGSSGRGEGEDVSSRHCIKNKAVRASIQNQTGPVGCSLLEQGTLCLCLTVPSWALAGRSPRSLRANKYWGLGERCAL